MSEKNYYIYVLTNPNNRNPKVIRTLQAMTKDEAEEYLRSSHTDFEEYTIVETHEFQTDFKSIQQYNVIAKNAKQRYFNPFGVYL